MMRRTLLLSAFFGALLAGPFLAYGAQIYIDPATGKYPPGVAFAVDIRLDNQNQCINAAEVNLAYPKGILEAVDVSGGNSIFSLWVKEPTIYKEYGIVSFVGGLPGGYCGRVAGDPTLSNKLATVYFRFPTSTQVASGSLPQAANLTFLSGTRAVVNDGLGTLAAMTTGGASYTQILKGQYAAANAWESVIQGDEDAPEAFKVGVYRDPSLFENKLFAVFSTVDKKSGIDHYEVAEVPTKDIALGEGQWKWARAVSPYLIKNQSIDGMIEVRAIDKAGNETLAAYSTQKLPPTTGWQVKAFTYLAIIGIVGAVLVQFLIRILLVL